MTDVRRANGCPYALAGPLAYTEVPPVQLVKKMHPAGWPMIAVAPPPLAQATEFNQAGIRGWLQVMNCSPDGLEDVLNRIFKPHLQVTSAGVVVKWSVDAVAFEMFTKNQRLADVMIPEDWCVAA